MKKFLLKLGLFLLPFIIILSTFFIFDPFKILYQYDDYYAEMGPTLNAGFVATEIYTKNKEKYNIDSFILGSSRSLAFKCPEWEKYIEEDSACFHLNSSGESIRRIWKNLEYLDESNDDIHNALIILDSSALGKITKSDLILSVQHPEVSKDSWFNFYKLFINAYFSDNFFLKYLKFKIQGKYTDDLAGFIDNRNLIHEPSTHDLYYKWIDDQIASQPQFHKRKIFYARSEEKITDSPRINKTSEKMLKEIEEIFKKHNTNYKIIISPIYDQKYINQNDLHKLEEIFDAKNVYDYSGKNKFTNTSKNYYETSHYRPCVAKRILEEIYGTHKKNDKFKCEFVPYY